MTPHDTARNIANVTRPTIDEALGVVDGVRRIVYCVIIAVIVLHPTVSTNALGHQTIKHATFTMLSRER